MNASDIAFVFPGMGPTRFPDSARFMLVNRYARELLQIADEVLGHSLFDRYEATWEQGDYAVPSQLAFMVNSLALAAFADEELGVRPDVLAGPSFGGRALAAYSGALPAREAIALAARWAACVEDYFAREHGDLVTHSFTRTPAPALAEIRAELDDLGEWHELSCHIDEDFFMLSVRQARVDWLGERIRKAGGMSLYTMRPAMHAAVLGRLREKVAAEAFGDLTFADPAIPVIGDHDGTRITTGAGLRAMLLDGIVRTVRWPVVVEALRAQDVGTVYVTGVDSLFGRVRATTRHLRVVAVDPRLALRPRRRVPISG